MSETADTDVSKIQGGAHNSTASTEEDLSEKEQEAENITVGDDIPSYREDCKRLCKSFPTAGIGHSPGDEGWCTTRDIDGRLSEVAHVYGLYGCISP